MNRVVALLIVIMTFQSAPAVERLPLLLDLNVGKFGYVTDIAFKDSIAYLATGYEGVKILDFGDRKDIRIKVSIPLVVFVEKVLVQGNCLCIAGDSLKIADVTIAAHPFIGTTWEVPSRVIFLESAGDFIRYYCNDNYAPRYVNVSDVSDTQIWTTDDFNQRGEQGYKGDTLFKFEDEGFRVVDRSHPFDWQEIGKLDYGCCADYWARLGQLCIQIRDGWLQVVDATNPKIPVVLADYGGLNDLVPYNIKAFGHLALVSTCKGGVQLIDVRNPMHITLLANTGQDIKPHSEGALGSTILGTHYGLAFIQTDDFRLLIYDISKYIE